MSRFLIQFLFNVTIRHKSTLYFLYLKKITPSEFNWFIYGCALLIFFLLSILHCFNIYFFKFNTIYFHYQAILYLSYLCKYLYVIKNYVQLTLIILLYYLKTCCIDILFKEQLRFVFIFL